MNRYYDEDGIDAPFERAVARLGRAARAPRPPAPKPVALLLSRKMATALEEALVAYLLRADGVHLQSVTTLGRLQSEQQRMRYARSCVLVVMLTRDHQAAALAALDWCVQHAPDLHPDLLATRNHVHAA